VRREKADRAPVVPSEKGFFGKAASLGNDANGLNGPLRSAPCRVERHGRLRTRWTGDHGVAYPFWELGLTQTGGG
jgi:hypothetical protein